MKIEIKKGDKTSRKLYGFMNQKRLENYKENINLFYKKYHKNSLFVFVKDKGEITSFGFLRPVKIDFNGKKYDILGIGGIFSIKKGKGYGKILIRAMVKKLKQLEKTGLGFCGKDVEKFYKKAGLKIKKDFSHKLAMKNPKTEKIIEDPDLCSAIYYEGKEEFISKIIKSKKRGFYWMPDIKEPHW